MPVLIDGNNLLFAAREIDDPDRAPGRAMLCRLLSQWAQRRNESVHVVFDGPKPAGGFAEQIASASVSVSFSGPQSADDVLIDLLRAHSAPRTLVVVSTDRVIRRAAQRRRAIATESAVFWRDVRAELSRKEVAPDETRRKKQEGLSADEAAAWLDEFDIELDDRDVF